MKIYNKSPMNYIGNKYKLLPQIVQLFPEKINKMVDLFCGGCDVITNVVANELYANDINNFVIDIFKYFQSVTIDCLLYDIDLIINKYQLSKTNKDGYLQLRQSYNLSKKPLELYVLVCYSFNYQFRFNSLHEYNSSFGLNRSSFNSSIRNNLVRFHKAISSVNFSSNDFRDFDFSGLSSSDFVYVDPPYLLTVGSYNDGKRGFKGWSQKDDKELFDLLDKLDNQKVSFALSNVLIHKNNTNELLKLWSNKYNVHYLDFNYKNSSYHAKYRDAKTVEILVTNY